MPPLETSVVFYICKARLERTTIFSITMFCVLVVIFFSIMCWCQPPLPTDCLLFPGDLHTVLDMAKVADTILFLLDPLEGWDSTGDYCLSCLFAQGLPTYSKWVGSIGGQGRKWISMYSALTICQTLCLMLDTIGGLYMYGLNLVHCLQVPYQDVFLFLDCPLPRERRRIWSLVSLWNFFRVAECWVSQWSLGSQLNC